jgi:hypothetical protein
MRLPNQTAGFGQRVTYGRYVVGRLKKAKKAALAASAEAATLEVKAAGRAVEDAEEPVQEALALRDGVDSELDDECQASRLGLASRSVDAVQKPPYTAVFPSGVDYYLAAPISEVALRYRELAARLEANLPEGDEQRARASIFTGGAEAYEMASKQVEEKRTALGLARTARDAAVDAWCALMERTYGALVAELDRKRADRFFPKARTRSAVAAESDED